MFLKMPKDLYKSLIEIANKEGKSASVFLIETLQKRLSSIRKEAKTKNS